tara:strand:+ start:723 stop:2213 length:1491 start_codon:yes stop_codon:yes gene_type:complete
VSLFNNYKYIFYDLETTGQNPCFDQVVRFAAKETDSNLDIINEYNISIKLRNDIIPHPKALLVNRLNIDDLNDGVVEYEAFNQIHDIMNQSKTINIGYNSLNFDDKFLRFGFYRNLLDPYTHQFGKSDSQFKFRADLYKMIFIYYLYKKDESIIWPTPNNRLSLKLEEINAINNLYDGMSHDAEVDVYVTIELAKKLKSIDHKMWDYLISSFISKDDSNYFNKLNTLTCVDGSNYKIGVFISNKNGLKSNYSAPVIELCTAYENGKIRDKKKRLLRLDNYMFEDFTEDNCVDKIQKGILSKTFGEPDFMLPFSDKYLRIFNEHITGLAKSNLDWIKHHPNAMKNLIQQHQNKDYVNENILDLDASLYQEGFFTSKENLFKNQFRQAKITDKINSIKSSNFENRIDKIALRILGRNYFDKLPIELQDRYSDYLNFIFHKEPSTADFIDKLRVDPNLLLKETREISKNQNLSIEDQTILNQLEDLIEIKIQTQQDLGF